MTDKLEKATGYSSKAFQLIYEDNLLSAFEIAPGLFEFCHEGPEGIEFQFSTEIIPYMDKTVEWNKKTGQFEGTFWGTLEHGNLTLSGWVTVDASDSTAFIPIEFDVIRVENVDGEDVDHPAIGGKFTRDPKHPFDIDTIEYEI